MLIRAEVAWQYDLRSGWAIRRRDVRASGAGARVNTAVHHLAKRGLVHVAEPTGFHDAPIALTTTGRAAIDGLRREALWIRVEVGDLRR